MDLAITVKPILPKIFSRLCNEIDFPTYKLHALEVDIMAVEDKYADEILSDEELDGVAGGTRIETFQDGNELLKRGLLTEKQVLREQTLRAASVRELLHKMGYTGYKDNDGSVDANIYTDKSGNVITREQFWKNFDADYSRTILEKFRV